MATVLETFDKWKEFLHDRVAKAKQSGMSEEVISNLAYQIGQFLDEKVDPQNDEERLLKELWDAGDEQERKVIARLMIKLVN